MQIFQPFVNLPSRSLKDYYQLIKQPTSLSGVQKKVRGVVGRNPPTGVSEYKSWSAFEDDVTLIWKNARIYNEDGSDIYNVSLDLEVCTIHTWLRSKMLTIVGNLQGTTCSCQGPCRRAPAAKAEAQHVNRYSGGHTSQRSKAAAEAQASTESRIRSQHPPCSQLCYAWRDSR